MLQIKDLCCGYGDMTVLRDINFELGEGETLALVGSNGAGKTTLLMSIAGHIIPKSGQVRLSGVDLVNTEPEKRCGLGVGLVPEGRRIFPDLSVFENLVVGGYSRPRNKQSENMARVVDIFPRLFDRKNQLAGSLSGGEQQMLAFGRAIMSNPNLMLVDELSLGLMPSVVDECYDALGKLVKKGIAVILVDQNSDAAMDFCSSSLILETGNQLWHGKSSAAPETSTY
jgi:branched-chain amino acid transport system ATP-binding protein